MYPWFHLGSFVISTYSLLYVCAYAAGGLLTYREARRQQRATEAVLWVVLGALGGGMIGAKLSMLIFLGPATFIKDLPYLWYSGQTWAGGFLGGYVGAFMVKRWLHIAFSIGDLFAPALPLGQAIGKIGNLLGGDPFGLPSTLPWAILQGGVWRQPSALYEMVLELLLFVLLWRLRGKLACPGDLFKLYVLSYCSLRFLVDFTYDAPHVLFDLMLEQMLFIPAILTCGYYLWKSYRQSRQAKTAAEASLAEAAWCAWRINSRLEAAPQSPPTRAGTNT